MMNNNVLPPSLTPYVQQCLRHQSLTLLTSVLDTPVNWLVGRFVIAALRGVNSATTDTQIQTASTHHGHVIFISLWRSYELWSDLLRKNGYDLAQAISTSKLCYLDGLMSDRASAPMPASYINLETLTLPNLHAGISQAERALHASSPSGSTTIIIDGLDLVLAMDPSLTATQTLTFLTNLHSRFDNLIIACSADSALLHNNEPGATPLEVEHSTLVRSLAYQAGWILACRPLETGAAKDVTGIVRASRGGAGDDDGNDEEGSLEDGEWLYQVKGDGSVRVWGRGE